MYLLFKKEETAIDTKWLSENYYRSNEIIIGSDQTQAYSKKSDIIHASFTDFQNNKVDLFAMFKVQYVDVFNIVHKTRLFAKRNGSEKEFSTCKKFNDAN